MEILFNLCLLFLASHFVVVFIVAVRVGLCVLARWVACVSVNAEDVVAQMRRARPDLESALQKIKRSKFMKSKRIC